MTDTDGTQEDRKVIRLPVTSGSRRSGNKTESGLTVKQEAFAQALADGETNADAYRKAYDASRTKNSVIYSEASRIASDPRIAARVAAILAERKRQTQHVTAQAAERVQDRVWRNVWKLAETAQTESVRATAIALAAKMAGMVTEKQEIKQVQGGSTALEAELKARLAKHLKAG